MIGKSKWNRFTTTQVADLAGCSRQTVRNARIAGQFPTAFKAGRDWSYAPAEAKRFAEYFNSTEFDNESEEAER